MKLFRRSTIRSISAADVQGVLEEGALVVDVRTLQEWRAGHLPFAQHIPLDDLEPRIDAFDSEQLTVFVCRSGHRSESAAEALATHGYAVASLAGGMAACRRTGLPVVRADGSPGQVI